jgi:hypothetical protein
LTIIYAQKREVPSGRDRIDWKLITDLPVSTPLPAIEKLEWYASRWKSETFHKIVKSGCKAEESKLHTADRLVNLIAVFCILSWRIFWMTMLNRSTSDAPTSIAFTPTECQLLDHLIPDRAQSRSQKKLLSSYIIKVARLGGYLARASDPPRGNIVLCGASLISMVQSTDLWNLDDPLRLVRLNCPTLWCVLIQGQVRAGLVMICCAGPNRRGCCVTLKWMMRRRSCARTTGFPCLGWLFPPLRR